MKRKRKKQIAKRSDKSISLQATVKSKIVKLSSQPGLSLAFCCFDFEHETEQNREQNASSDDSAWTSSRHGTGLRPSRHVVFANTARRVCRFHVSQQPPKSAEKAPFPCEKGAFSVSCRQRQNISSTFSVPCKTLRHFRNPVGGYEGCISAAFSEHQEKAGCKPSRLFTRQNVKRLGIAIPLQVLVRMAKSFGS